MINMMDLSKLRIDTDCSQNPNSGGSSAIDRLSAMVAKSAATESGDFSETKFEQKAKTRRRGKSYRTSSEFASQRCRSAPRRAQSKILKFFNILIISLLYHHQCLSNVYQPTGVGVQADQIGAAMGNLSKPAQFFMATDQRQSIKLVGGGIQPRSEEEEEGFIMRASPSVIPQNQPPTSPVLDHSTPTSEKALAAGTDAPNFDQPTTVDADDQRIPINSNRQQYITHDQLSLLNASTKDEHINLTSNDQEVQTSSSSLLQKAQSPRTGGMSKVSHVSSFISDYLLALASKYQPRISSSQEDQQYVAAGQRTANSVPQTTTTTTAAATTTTSPKPTPVPSSASACPGVCRSFLTAPILCHNEINAACPSIFQKCCEKDDVSFNGTPVETSAPLIPSDSDPNPAPLSDNLQHVQEQSTPDYQANLPQTSTAPATSEKPVQQQQQQQQQRLNQARDGTEPAGKLPAEGSTVSSLPVNFQQPAKAVYFLSSGNGSEPSGESGELEKGGPGRQQEDLAQPAHDRAQQQQQSPGAEQPSKPYPTSQSFDSPLMEDEKAPGERLRGNQSNAGERQRNANKQVMLQTVNGTILHQPNSERYRRPPTYANWTDYHLSRHTRPSGGNGVVYHPNTDPVKRPLGSAGGNFTTTVVTANTAASTQVADAAPKASTPAAREQGSNGSNLRRSAGNRADPSLSHVEPHLTVLNDQHSMGTKPMPPRPQQSVSSTTSTVSSGTTNTVLATTTVPPPPEPPVNRLSTTQASFTSSPVPADSAPGDQSEDNQPLKGVDSILAGLLNWFVSPSSSSAAEPSAANQEGGLEAHSTDQVASFAPADNPGQQTNDRRLGLDLSFRQHDQSNASAANQMTGADDAGLMTSDGSSEQASLAEPGYRCEQPNYCVQFWFKYGCDHSYRSGQCGNDWCCVNRQPTSGGQQNEVDGEQLASGQVGGGGRQPEQNCRDHGQCLAVYQQSLCTKPNELVKAAGCSPSQVCCMKPSGLQQLDGTGQNHIENTVDSYMGGSSELMSSVSGGPPSDLIKDSSLFAALLPPPPPSLSAAGELQDKSQQLGDQFLAAGGRQRPSGSIMQPVGQESIPAGSVQQAAFYQRPAGAIKSSQSGGIMSHIYQMFKSNGAGKQRNRPQQPSVQQAAVPSFMSQMFEPYQIAGPSGVRTSHQVQATPQQQLVYPMQQQQQQAHNVMLSQQPAGNYAPSNNYPSFSELEMGAKQQGNRNVFMQHNAQMLPVDPQQQQFSAGYAGSNPAIQMANGQQPLKGVSYGHQSQMVPAANVHPFNGDNGQLGPINQEKFAAHNLEQQSSGGFGQPTGTGNQQNYVKPFMAAGQQVLTSGGSTGNKQPNVNSAYPIQTSSGLYLNDRQRFYHAGGGGNNNINGAPDNAHNLPFNQGAQKNGQHPLPKQNQFAPIPSSYSGQPLAYGLGAASVQQQQQHQQQLQPVGKLAETSVNRPIGVGQQQVVRQQQYVTGARNGNGAQESFNVEQQRILQRQNAASRVPTMASHVVEHSPSNRQQQRQQDVAGADTFPSHPIVQSAVSRAPPHLLAAPNRLASMEQPALVQKVAAPEPTRTSGTNKVLAPIKPSAPNTKGWSANDVSQSSAPISPSSSNLNVMISSAPYFGEQQRPDGMSPIHLPSAPRRQASQQLPPSGGGLVSQSRPPMVFSSPILSAEQQIRKGEEPAQAPTCPSFCLAPFVSFNCAKPNYIDKSLTCPTAGTVCCVSPQAGSTKGDLLQQTLASTGTPRPALSIVDSNKLDASSSSDNDEQLEETSASKQQVVGGEPSVALSGADQTPQTEAGVASALVGLEESSAPTSPERNRFQCGLRGSRRRQISGNARARVMGGFNSRPGDWCWQAALMNNKNEYLCGGALIGSKWVLTAAHCVTQHLRNETQLFVRLGQHNLNNTSGSQHAKTIQVRTSYVHHNHNSVTLDNDIALLRLEEPLNLEEPSICLVCLPERSSQMEAGKRCTVTGYGFETESGPAALRIRQTDLPIVTDQECQNKTSAVLAKPFALPASSFCAGGEAGQDACHGDGGSPLSCLVNGYYELTGIVSWGYKCGSKDLPGLYSKVSAFVGWINQIVSVNN